LRQDRRNLEHKVFDLPATAGGVMVVVFLLIALKTLEQMSFQGTTP
jgi:hypothetical protein